jgi:hypothetical protein
MENGKKSAFAYAPTYEHGLNKREYFAGLVMQGILSYDGQGGSPELYAKNAVQFADALLKELENTK